MLFVLLACSRPAMKVTAAATTATCAAGCATHLDEVGDVDLPGAPVRFDYQEIDAPNGHLVIAHMNDDSVDIVSVTDGSTLAEIPDVPTARGVTIGSSYIYVTSSPNQVARIDRTTLALVDKVTTGRSPDGIDYDPDHAVVGVSDQGDGAISFLAQDGDGEHTQVQLGDTTGNVRYDAERGWFWITVEHGSDPDQLVAVDPVTGDIKKQIDVDHCDGAHGLRLHPDGTTAYIACEGNATLVRVNLDDGSQDSGATTPGPDVLAIDPDFGWLYVAAEGGATSIYDITKAGVSLVGTQDVGDNSHTVAADPTTHHVFFPLESGPDGTPILRIMKPASD
jgi:DNA-binding beta-propeller fold protein YncE